MVALREMSANPQSRYNFSFGNHEGLKRVRPIAVEMFQSGPKWWHDRLSLEQRR